MTTNSKRLLFVALLREPRREESEPRRFSAMSRWTARMRIMRACRQTLKSGTWTWTWCVHCAHATMHDFKNLLIVLKKTVAVALMLLMYIVYVHRIYPLSFVFFFHKGPRRAQRVTPWSVTVLTNCVSNKQAIIIIASRNKI